eukprot:CAMPEP_0195606718 /NCGR_PEP_ID=MMETSP0815-20121206/7832_1 /TAXON_ID=97485 /ORGANISM="Prymnesium parvum, Strain Texoma1" /LENGTH=168 /DNA_ID=CAMNT_0040746473 /DNA_START=32 /DNA_END=535 /DNA_ORIENTATION=-
MSAAHDDATLADTCEPCPSGLSSAPGSSSCDLCAAGRYLAFGQTASAANCILCPPGAFCETNTTVETLKILHGYWRLTTLTSKISACAKTASAGDPPACKGGTAGAATCAANHTGPLCEVCLQDHQYFNDGACRNCPPVLPIMGSSSQSRFCCLCCFLLASSSSCISS